MYERNIHEYVIPKLAESDMDDRKTTKAQKSNTHRTATEFVDEFMTINKGKVNIHSLISQNYQGKIESNRAALLSTLDVIDVLVRRGIALRGSWQ